MTIAFKPINKGDAKMVGKLAALHHRVFGDGAPVPPQAIVQVGTGGLA